jgi:hypothetical protein
MYILYFTKSPQFFVGHVLLWFTACLPACLPVCLSVCRYAEYHNTAFLYQYNPHICVILFSVSINV